MKITWTKRASYDLRSLRAYIAQDNPKAAQSVARRILESVERLEDYPASGRRGRLPNTRELVIPGTPFIIPYRIRDGIVEILAVMHAARQWPER